MDFGFSRKFEGGSGEVYKVDGVVIWCGIGILVVTWSGNTFSAGASVSDGEKVISSGNSVEET